MLMEDLVVMVRDVNPHRTPANLNRRLLKVLEELGETSEAYLSVSSPHNYKNKTWEDYREESVDTLIVLIDVALTKLGDAYTPFALIPSSIDIATGHAFTSLDDLTFQKFEVAGAVAKAASHLRNNDFPGFYGSIQLGIQAAANMCFALIPDDKDREVINQRVHETFVRKIDKWNKGLRMYAATDDG